MAAAKVETDDELYKNLIDQLVDECSNGQGQIASRRVLRGKWNTNPLRDIPPDQREVNSLLRRLSGDERKILARLLAAEFVGGVHQTLVALHEAEIRPFERAYEGTPFHDFIGRLAGWRWPRSRARS